MRKKPAGTGRQQPGKKGTAIPSHTEFQPMLATLVDLPPDDSKWTYEIKWDGYRALAFFE